MQQVKAQQKSDLSARLMGFFSFEKTLLVVVVFLLVSQRGEVQPEVIRANLSDTQVQQITSAIVANQSLNQINSSQYEQDSNNQIRQINAQVIEEIKLLKDEITLLQQDLAQRKNSHLGSATEIPLEQQQQAVAQIELRLQQAIQNGSWSANDSESIIEHVALISLHERMRLLDLFAQAAEQGLSSIAEYPPPL
ncbi:hypothetical protein ACUR5C_11475 [Aliikangiella sp. IMCC44653]